MNQLNIPQFTLSYVLIYDIIYNDIIRYRTSILYVRFRKKNKKNDVGYRTLNVQSALIHKSGPHIGDMAPSSGLSLSWQQNEWNLTEVTKLWWRFI
jgi:hypothetical protein